MYPITRIVEMISIYSLLLLLKCCASERHSLFWNPSITPELLGDGLVKHVKIGDFLDIMCPHTGLTGTVKPNATSVFDIYNVTSEEFDHCRVQENKRLFFKCDRPDQENKLTLKMQTFSPSPFGFKFNYCHNYYYIAVPRRTNMTSCGKDTTRFKLSVACKKTTTTTTKATTTTTTTTTTSTTTTVISKLPIEDKIDIDEFDSTSRRILPNGRNNHPKLITGGNQQIDHKSDEDSKFDGEPEKEAFYGSFPNGDSASSSLASSTLSVLLSVLMTSCVVLTSLG